MLASLCTVHWLGTSILLSPCFQETCLRRALMAPLPQSWLENLKGGAEYARSVSPFLFLWDLPGYGTHVFLVALLPMTSLEGLAGLVGRGLGLSCVARQWVSRSNSRVRYLHAHLSVASKPYSLLLTSSERLPIHLPWSSISQALLQFG